MVGVIILVLRVGDRNRATVGCGTIYRWNCGSARREDCRGPSVP